MMSRPLPCGMPSTMSMRATSHSSLSASRWASVAPTFPAPTTVTFLFISFLCALCASSAASALNPLEVFDDGGRELRRLQHLRPLHLALEVVGHALLPDRSLQRRLDGVRGLPPAHVAE